MNVVQRRFSLQSRGDTFRIYPIGDIHIGAAEADEEKLKRVVSTIAEDENAFWIGLGDYADFITMRDPRFSVGSLAPWLISYESLSDIAAAQRDRFLKIVEPIAHKCLALVEGNHEASIHKHYERDIFSDIVSAIKTKAREKHPDTVDKPERLGIGYAGWLDLRFVRRNKNNEKGRSGVPRLTIYLHHGFVGGRLQGAKALNMQRMLWAYDADIIIMGHSHNTMVQWEAVYGIDKSGNPIVKRKVGIYSGTFLKSFREPKRKKGNGKEAWGYTYAERKGYYPMPLANVGIEIRPAARNREDIIRVFTF